MLISLNKLTETIEDPDLVTVARCPYENFPTQFES